MIKLHKKAKIGTGIAALALGLFVGGLATFPFGANALDNSRIDKPTSQQISDEADKRMPTGHEVTADVNVTNSPDTESPVTEPAPQPVPEVTEPDETEAPNATPVETLQAAIAIAAAEHEGSAVVVAKTKMLGAETVYKITFQDGWRIYVSADDGELKVVEDGQGNRQGVHNRARAAWLRNHDSWNPWEGAYKNWSKKWVEGKGWKWHHPTPPQTPETPELPTIPAEGITADGEITVNIGGREYVLTYNGTLKPKAE